MWSSLLMPEEQEFFFNQVSLIQRDLSIKINKTLMYAFV